MQDGVERPVCYYSKSLTDAQQRYLTHNRELYAIVEACRWWRPYIEGTCCKVLTDHEPLEHIFTQHDLNKWQCRWVEKLAETSIKIVYRPGKEATVPDALSRRLQMAAEAAVVAAQTTFARINTVLVEPWFLQRLSKA